LAVSHPKNSRRSFLKATAVAASAVAVNTLPIVRSAHAAGSDIIRIGLIGCGGRGPGAANDAMTVDEGVHLVAMTDIHADRVADRRMRLQKEKPKQVNVDDAHCFSGLDGYKQVIASADVVLVACAAKFHPYYLMEAIKAGKHVFVEKPHAIDPVGVRQITAAATLAKEKGLSIMSGLHSRHEARMQETIRRVHDGAIGEIIAIEENFLRPPYGLYPRLDRYKTEVEYQLANQYHFAWLSGDDVPQSLIHNLDRATWALKDQVPVDCHGIGGRSASYGEIYGDVFDHHGVVYRYKNGVRLYAFCSTQNGCYGEYSSLVLGTKGRASIMTGRIEGQTNWHFQGNSEDGHVAEHRPFFQAIRSGTPINAGDYMARSTLLGVMGQLSCYSGKEVTWEQAMNSNFSYAPKPEDVTLDMEPPVKVDANKEYPVFARPGFTKFNI
jgi:myo-inositol 2-dehydrogenase / D-chiro-inositol 1-dehydrogenase